MYQIVFIWALELLVNTFVFCLKTTQLSGFFCAIFVNLFIVIYVKVSFLMNYLHPICCPIPLDSITVGLVKYCIGK